jgi:ATP adenylyltransferase
MSDVIWAPWRSIYLSGTASSKTGCLFCDVSALGEEARAEAHVLCVQRAGLVMLNRYPYTGGHLMVAPLAHVASPEELGSEEHDALFRLLRESVASVKRVVRPHGVNVGMNLGAAAGAGIPGHLHIHIVPRWEGDVNFMTSVAGARVISRALDESFQELFPVFQALPAL